MRECLSVSPLDLYYYYNDNPDPAGLASREHNCAAHEDRGLLSVIALSPVPGLQLKVPAPPAATPPPRSARATPSRDIKSLSEKPCSCHLLPPALSALPCLAQPRCLAQSRCSASKGALGHQPHRRVPLLCRRTPRPGGGGARRP